MPDGLLVCYPMPHKYKEHCYQYPQQLVCPVHYIYEAYHPDTLGNIFCDDPLHKSKMSRATYSAPHIDVHVLYLMN